MTLVDLDTLPAMDVAGRARAAPSVAADAGVDALLVTHLPNVRYLTGFTGSSAMLLVTDDALVFTSDGRYRTQADEQLAPPASTRRSRSAPPSRSSATRSPPRSHPVRASAWRPTR